MDSIMPTLQRKVPLPQWKVDLTVLFTEEGNFYVVREVCQILGIADIGQQIKELNDRTTTNKHMQLLPVDSGRGIKATWCLRRKGLAYWIGFINPKKVAPDVRERLEQFQDDAADAVDRMLHGEIDITDTDKKVIQIDVLMTGVKRDILAMRREIEALKLKGKKVEQLETEILELRALLGVTDRQITFTDE